MSAPTNIKTTLTLKMTVGSNTYDYSSGEIELKQSRSATPAIKVADFDTFKNAVRYIVNTLANDTDMLTQTEIDAIQHINTNWYTTGDDKLTNFIALFTVSTTKEEALKILDVNSTLTGGKGPQKGSSSKITRRRKSKGKKRAGTRHYKKGKR